MNFPSVDSAVAYIGSKIQAFFHNSQVLKDRLMKIGALIGKAKLKNDQEALGQLIVLQTQTKALFNEQLQIEQKLHPFVDYFNTHTTLGAFPVILIGAAIGVAGLMYLQFERIQNDAKKLELVERKLLTGAEAGFDAPFIGAGAAFGFSMPLVIGAGVFLFMFLGMGRRA